MKKKVCTKCKKLKPFVEFYKLKHHKDGHASHCKACNHKKVREWTSVNKDRCRNLHLERKYGITLGIYNQMFKEQQGCCAICNTHQSNLTHALSVDHNHITQEVRGLLCKNCNAALGQFKGDGGVSLLRKAISYIKIGKRR